MSPQKSLPALRQTLLNSQQSLMTAPPSAVVTPPATPGSVTATTIRPRLPISPAGGTVRLNAPIGTAALVRIVRLQVNKKTFVTFDLVNMKIFWMF